MGVLLKYFSIIRRKLMDFKKFSLSFGESKLFELKDAATDMRYFARSKFSRSLVHKKNFSLIWQVIFKSQTAIL